MRISLDGERGEGVWAAQQPFHCASLPRAGSPHTCMNGFQVALPEPRLGESPAGGGQNGGPDEIWVETDIRRSAYAFAKQDAIGIAKPGAAFSAAAVDAEE
jgi:hypothetical protein